MSFDGATQNLVPDPGFEIYTDGNYSNTEYLGELDFWWTANATPDYHNTNHPPGSNLTSLEDCPLGNGQTQCGIPFEGEAVLGIYKANDVNGSKEWAGTQLSEPMVDGECYIVSFWIQNKKDNPNFLMESSNWGIYFSSTPVPSFDPNTLDFDLVSDSYLKTDELLDSNDWRYYEWAYTANFDYEFIYVGYMGNVSDAIESAWSSSSSIGFYTWFDMVSIIPIDSVEIAAQDDIELCEDSTAFLTATCNVNYQWAWDNGSSFSSDSILEVSPSVTTTYYAFAGDFVDCVKMDSVTVTVIDCSCLIPIETTFEVVDNTNCPLSEPGNGLAIVNPSNGIEPYFFLWNDPLMQQNDTATGLAGGNYICIITDADNCTDTVYLSIDEGEIPTLLFDVTPESCIGSSDGAIDLTVQDGNNPFTYLWSNNATTEDLIFVTAGTYTVTATDNLDCPFTDSVEVGVAEPVVYEFPLICEGSDVVDLNVVGANNGVWSGPGIVDATLGLFDPVIAGVGEFDIIFTSNLFCSDNFTMEVLVDALPNVNFTSNVVGGCQTLDVLFSVSDAGPNALYIWNFGDGSVSSDPINTSYAYVNYGIYDVALSITDSSGCSNSMTYQNYIDVYERPVADFDYTPEEVDDVQSTVQFYNTSSAVAVNYFWSFGDGGTSYQEDPIYEYTAPGYYRVKLSVSSVFGCLDTAINYIKYKDVIFMYVPNAFTPNGDGRNDFFQVKAMGEVDLFSMKIFDRWGELVFETKDINEPWVGNYQNGDYYLTTGVFSYLIEYEAWGPSLDEPIGEKFTGTVMLLK